LATPPIRGVLREPNGGPIAGISLWLSGPWPARTPEVITDAAGAFTIPPSQEICTQNSNVTFQFHDGGHWYLPASFPLCTASRNPAEMSFEFKGERILDITVGSPIVITLSNDDLDWIYPYEPQCGPCRGIRFPLPSTPGTALVHVSWTGPDPVHLWLEGENDDYEYERLSELNPVAGEHAMTLIAPQEFRRLYPWLLKVGLPTGSRSSGGFSAPTTVRLEVEVVS
jgi:hypothetical protein